MHGGGHGGGGFHGGGHAFACAHHIAMGCHGPAERFPHHHPHPPLPPYELAALSAAEAMRNHMPAGNGYPHPVPRPPVRPGQQGYDDSPGIWDSFKEKLHHLAAWFSGNLSDAEEKGKDYLEAANSSISPTPTRLTPPNRGSGPGGIG